MKFHKLKIAAKLSVSLGIILIVMGGINIFTIIKMSALKSKNDILSNDRLITTRAISGINKATLDYRMLQFKHVEAINSISKTEYELEMEEANKSVHKFLQKYQSVTTLNKEESKISQSVDYKWDDYTNLNKEFLILSNNEMYEEAIFFLNFENRSDPESLFDNIDLLSKLNQENIEKISSLSKKIYGGSIWIISIVFILTSIFSIYTSYNLSRLLVTPLRKIDNAVKKITQGDDISKLRIVSNDEIGELANSFNQMAASIRKVKKTNMLSDWFKTGENGLNEQIRGDLDILTLSKRVIAFLAKYLNAKVGAIYLWEAREEVLKLVSGYSFNTRKTTVTSLKLGEGIVGQAAYEKEFILLTDVPTDYIFISSSLGYTKPTNLIVVPFMFEDQLIGVIELGSLYEFGEKDVEFLRMISENIAISFYSANSRSQIKFLLHESQQKSMELQAQQEELKTSNEELEAQTQALKISETKLKDQQEELQSANEELEHKTTSLEKQRNEIVYKNRDLEVAQKDIEKKAKQLEITSKYKSEFLANMSHELRTPLNSLLILSRNLSENKQGNLDEDQVEGAKIIHKSGNDLLMLINEILDLSKIEAGKMTINIEKFPVSDLTESLEATFRHMANEKDLKLDIITTPDFPELIQTDFQRLEQVIKNLLSNAIKFTLTGGIILQFSRPKESVIPMFSALDMTQAIAIAVIDTGIGISEEKQKTIFEAFQQGDGGTARRFGGTGLGLSISREIAKMLGGELQVESVKDKGSTFTLLIPYTQELKVENKTLSQPPLIRVEQNKTLKPKTSAVPNKSIDIKTYKSEIIEDQAPLINFSKKIVTKKKGSKKDNKKRILIIEDDASFAKILGKQCKERGFEYIITPTGEEGIAKANEYIPTAIILDIKLPGISGWKVIEKLKNDHKLRHIPIHMMSVDEVEKDALHSGAIGFLTKPVSMEKIEEAFGKLSNVIDKNIKDLLIVEDNEELRRSIYTLIKDEDVNITETDNGTKALQMINENKFDCMILDLGLPDMTGFELLNELNTGGYSNIPPVIVYTGHELSYEEEFQLKKYSDSIIIKGVKSEDRLLDETALFLHQVVSDMPLEKKKMIVSMYNQDEIFNNKKVLLVDDDMRNVFALSKILKDRKVKVQIAEDGSKALKILEKDDKIDLILMDIMMPIMDGYETMRQIRKKHKFSGLPIIALTAKAMKDDREKCIQAGASDYLPKPLDEDRLLSMMRVWLYK